MNTTSRARQLFPSAEEDGYIYFYDYKPIYTSFGEVLVNVEDDGYSGDTRLLLTKDGKYGFLIIGWGSCAGCDVLQSCDNFNEVDDLINQLENEIKWFDQLDQVKEYIGDKEKRSESYYAHDDNWQVFVEKVMNITP